MSTVRTRFAPSPTGYMHVGNLRTALYTYLMAKHEDGTFILRIDDTDPTRSTEENTQIILRAMRWLGLDWDRGPYWQSERGAAYDEAIERLAEAGLIYPCFCSRAELHAASAPHASDGTPVYAGTCRGLSGTIEFCDLAYGPRREVLARECGDFLVRRSDGVVAYQLAVVVDDALMGVTQVVRGRDLLGSCARQIYLGRLLGWEPPEFGHVPLLVAPDGRRLSKREKDLDLGALRERGVTPERVIGLLAAAAGLAEPGCEATPSELVAGFSWERLRREDLVVDDAFLARLL